MEIVSNWFSTGLPASGNEADVTRRLETAAAAYAQSSCPNLQDVANGTDSLPNAGLGKHDNSADELSVQTGTAGNSRSVTDKRVNEGSPVRGSLFWLQRSQTTEPDAKRPEAEHGDRSTEPDQVDRVAEAEGRTQLQTDVEDDELAKRLGRKVLEYQRCHRLLQQATGKREECLSCKEEVEKFISSEQTMLESMRTQAQLLQNKVREKEANTKSMQGLFEHEAAFRKLSDEETLIEKPLASEKQIGPQRVREEQTTGGAPWW
ncbi:hypothetical protein B0A49_08193 [Cryomyces minteri]|uniref:Uncharacterized protein n=1 Tax=Cryomyces minteri TaxID=331657 RepID=A0A4U0XSM0_9PEZI|nr:hypothetical protein B0A49_08193 [Cryomyces minteri]